MMASFLTPYGGRRFLLSIGCAFVTTFLLWFGKIDPTTWRDVILGTVAVYIAGATTQKFAKQPPAEGG